MHGFPRKFGSYALAKPLARGGMGALYLAVSEARERAGAGAGVCVIKTVLPHLADKEYVQRFRDEAKVVLRLQHENLVPVFDSGQVGGELYLGMSFIDGRDLRAIWNRCAKKGVAFPVDVAVFIVRELARGLAYAHDRVELDLVHRDVSPPNVLVSYAGAVKLTDFGLASSTLKIEKTLPGIIYGKVSYMSPEQARSERLDGRSDLYAAGIILWELLTGRQLFAAAPPPAPGDGKDSDVGPAAAAEELLRRVRNPQLVPPSKRASRVPAELDRIALRALAPKLEDRYPNCAAFADDLTAYLEASAPTVDAVRVAAFLDMLYGEDLANERRERERVLGDARKLFQLAPPAIADSLAGLTLPVAARPSSSPTSPEPSTPIEVSVPPPPEPPEPPPPQRRSERRTRVGHSGAEEISRHHDSVSAAFAETIASSSNPGAGTGAVVGSVVGGRYRVGRLCGEGGMGRVYEAEHIEIQKRVALKILHPAYSQTPDLVERLRREARAASRIGHPNVVDVTDSGTTDDGAFFFVMEYLEGREIGEIVFREGGLDVRRALFITGQVCRALQAAHDAGVIHRDLKPENVLIVARDGQKDFVKVLDFGIAKSLAESEDEATSGAGGSGASKLRRKLTSPGVAMGTPEYMAPEQAAGRTADARSDIYAVGGILYEMLAGKPAYEGSNFMEILHKKANLTPAALKTFRDDVPAELEALIQRTMAKNPDARPQTMSALEAEIQAIAATLPPSSGDRATAAADVALLRAAATPVARPRARAVGGWRRLVEDRRTLAGVAAGALGLLFLVGFGVTRSRASAARSAAMAAAPRAPVPVQPPPAPPPPVTAPAEEPAATLTATAVVPEAPAPEGDGADEHATEEETEASAATPPAGAAPAHATRAAAGGRSRGGTSGPSAAEAKRQLADAEQLLRAQRFSEARQAFARLTKSRPVRVRALVALAEIAFQEKNYEEAVRSARLAADRGGGARARVVLGDAHFRLSRYQDAASAYEQALRLDPKNSSAKSGLAAASKRL